MNINLHDTRCTMEIPLPKCVCGVGTRRIRRQWTVYYYYENKKKKLSKQYNSNINVILY